MKKTLLLSALIIFLVGCSTPQSNQNTSIEINSKLETIMESPIMASNPYEYIKHHPEEYAFLIAKGEITLQYFLNEFGHTNDNGLRQYIMAAVCNEIVGPKNSIRTWKSGQDWYEQYSRVQRALEYAPVF